MIESRKMLMEYLEADRIALRRRRGWGWLVDDIWRYERVMRKHEYYINTKGRNIIWWVMCKYYGWRQQKIGIRLGFSISPNCFGPGLVIWHYGSILVHPKARIGANAQINAGCVIGKNDKGEAPVIGANLKCQPGAKICGNIVLGDNVRVGLNAVVTHSFPRGNCVLVGVPARPLVKE